MNLTEALAILRDAPNEARLFDVTLACGFTPLHLHTFLSAHLQRVLPQRRVSVSCGLYGNLTSTVEAAAKANVQNLAIALEWPDLDVRLGSRAFAVPSSTTISEILRYAERTLERLEGSIGRLAPNTKIAISMPTLPLPPFFHTPGWQMGEAESLLQEFLSKFATKLASAGVLIVSETRLAEERPLAERYDLKSDLLFGLPYTIKHASTLGSSLARLLCPPTPKKGIITDLDDTLWSGLVGEVGAEGVHWDLDNHSGFHGLYQRFLATLAGYGVLIGVASKNNAAVVQKVFERPDILLRPEHVFPMEVHWNAKSASVGRILRTWNVAADSVVFIDDSPMELAEVAAAHPDIECIRFPRKDYEAGFAMLRHMGDLFGKQRLSTEDFIRLASIRRSTEFETMARESNPETFLQEANASVHLDFDASTKDPRVLELVNKTNQFNLNGIRYTESDWASALADPGAQLIAASYEDRFGRLGKIAVIIANLLGDTLRIRVWVMSCRAFARRIEYLCLRHCFERFPIRKIQFDFLATSKNVPLQEFMTSLLGETPGTSPVLTRERFAEVCPRLYHTVTETRRPEVDRRCSEPVTEVF